MIRHIYKIIILYKSHDMVLTKNLIYVTQFMFCYVQRVFDICCMLNGYIKPDMNWHPLKFF